MMGNETKKHITILGAGSTGMATAAYLAAAGFPVTLCDTEEQSEDFEAIRRQGGILLRGQSGRNGCRLPAKLTCDFQEALADSDRVLVCVSAARHEEISKRIALYAREGQVFLFSPGNFGSLFLRKELEKAGCKNAVTAELSGNLWACRHTALGEVFVASPLKPGSRLAAFPAKDTETAIAAFADAFSFTVGTNVLETTLNSPNVISHVGGAVLNATGIERKGAEFAFFLDGLSEAVIKCLGGLEKERNAVLERMKLTVYAPDSEGFMRCLMNRGIRPELDDFRRLDGPSSFTHRYVSEDAACGVAMLVSLGEQYQVPVPLTKAVLNIAGAINDEDYLKSGRTLEAMSLAGLTLEELSGRLLGASPDSL